MPLMYYPGIDHHNNADRLHTISPSVPPADNGIPPANHRTPPADHATPHADHGTPPCHHGMPPAEHGTPVPPPSPHKCKMLPTPTAPTMITGMEQEQDGSNVGGLLMELAGDSYDDGTSSPAEEEAGTIPPVRTEKDPSTSPPAPTKHHPCLIPPAVTKQEPGTSPPAPTGRESSTIPEKPTDPRQNGTPSPDRPAAPSRKRSSSDDDYTEDKGHLSCFLKWLGLDPDCKRMLAHHKRMMGNKDGPMFQYAVNEDPELCIEAWAQATAAL